MKVVEDIGGAVLGRAAYIVRKVIPRCVAACCSVVQCPALQYFGGSLPCQRGHCQVCCSVLQCVAVQCFGEQRTISEKSFRGVLQYVAVCCRVLRCPALQCFGQQRTLSGKKFPGVLQCFVVLGKAVHFVRKVILRCVAVCCSVVHCVAVWYIVLQYVAV